MQQHGIKHFAHRSKPPPPAGPGGGPIGQNSTFSEHGQGVLVLQRGNLKGVYP